MLRIVVDDSGRGFHVAVYKEADTSVYGCYNVWRLPTGVSLQARPTGKNWRFHHWVVSGDTYIDDYKEFDATGLVWSPDERLTLGYDPLDRLTGVTKSVGALQGYNAGYGYNAIGNITGWTQDGTTLSYSYSVTQPHAVTQVVSATTNSSDQISISCKRTSAMASSSHPCNPTSEA